MAVWLSAVAQWIPPQLFRATVFRFVAEHRMPSPEAPNLPDTIQGQIIWFFGLQIFFFVLSYTGDEISG